MEFKEDQRNIWDVISDLRYGYSDDVPNQIVHSTDQNNKYKVRSGWKQDVLTGAQILIDTGQIQDPNLIKEIKRFADKNVRTGFGKPKLTTPKDIKSGNNILDEILKNRP